MDGWVTETSALKMGCVRDRDLRVAGNRYRKAPSFLRRGERMGLRWLYRDSGKLTLQPFKQSPSERPR